MASNAPAPAAAAFPRKVVMMDSYKHWKQDRRVRSIEDAVCALNASSRLHDGKQTHVEVLETGEDGVAPLAKFYFDFDETYEYVPTEEDKARAYALWAEYTAGMMEALGVDDADVAMATRSRAKDDKYKLSAHAVVQGYYATVPEIKAVATALRTSIPATDVAPYKSRQTFACVLCCKDAEHTEPSDVMRPMDETRPIADFLIQAFGPEDKRLVVPQAFMERFGGARSAMVSTYTSGDGTVLPVTADDQELAVTLLPLIKREASGDRDAFVCVGHHLHQIFDGNDAGLAAFDAWCAPHPSYKGARYVESKYRTFAPRADAPLGALCARARRDSPEAYAELMATRAAAVQGYAASAVTTQRFVELFGTTKDAALDAVVAEAVACLNDTSVALVALYLFGERIVCASKKHNLWYEFKDHRWRRDSSGSVIANALSFDMYERLTPLHIAGSIKVKPFVARMAELKPIRSKTAAQIAEYATLEQTHEPAIDMVKSFGVMMGHLRTVGPKSSIISEYANCSCVANRGFASGLDERLELLGFADGVYDLNKGEFRAGRPDDRLTMSTGYAFPTTDDAAKQAELMAFYRSCAPDDEVAAYDLRISAYNLGGNNYLEQLWFYTGVGRNGKGGKAKLLKVTFGDATKGDDVPRGYCYEPDASILTSKRTNPSAPCPEVTNARGVRLLLFSEPNNGAGSAFNVSLLKGLSGNDPWTGRELNMPPVTFQPQFGILGSMNNVPHLDGADNAFSKRLRVISHPHTFVEDPRLPNERQIDRTLKTKFENDVTYAQQFMRILLRIYREERLWDPTVVRAEPAAVLAATREVMEDDDQVREWLAEFGDRDAAVKTKVPDARAHFTTWVRRQDDRAEPLSNLEFNRRMRANGWKQGKASNSVRTYDGLSLRPLPAFEGDDADF